MKRFDAVNKVSQAILAENLAEAVFLKGSIARNKDDDFSDVDMYCIVSDENTEAFLSKRINYMLSYMPLIFWTEANFGCPQIVGVYENALHFDLYMATKESIPQTDDIKVIYDPNGLLQNYEKKPLSVTDSSIAEEINEFSFTLLEFENAYNRGDFIWATRLINAQMMRLSLFLRFIYDKDNARLGSKWLCKHIPKELCDEYIEILETTTPSKLSKAKDLLVKFENKVLALLPDSIQKDINKKFYDMMHSRILMLK